MQTCCLRRHHRCDELNEFWLCLQFVKFEGRLRPFVKLMKTVSNSSNSSNSLFKLKGGKLELRVHFKKSQHVAGEGAAPPLPCRGGVGVGSVSYSLSGYYRPHPAQRAPLPLKGGEWLARQFEDYIDFLKWTQLII